LWKERIITAAMFCAFAKASCLADARLTKVVAFLEMYQRYVC